MVVETPQFPSLNTTFAAPTSSASGEDHHPIKTLRRACDCCRKRKVRCDGSEPCEPCRRAAIRCAYLQPPKKKGPKGLRSARVLHALRRIDDTASGSSTGPLSPQQHGAFGDWGWSGATTSPTHMHFPDQMAPPANLAYGPPTSVAPDQNSFAHEMPPTMLQYPQPQTLSRAVADLSLYPQDSHHAAWVTQADAMSASSDVSSAPGPVISEALPRRLPKDSFLPYVQLFFDHMFSIMPVVDRNIYLDPALYTDPNSLNADVYCLLCALCAATVVQLDSSIPHPQPLDPCRNMDDVFAEECLRERKTYDYIDSSSSTLSTMTSFFLFAYYGNHEQHSKAWHYLQESITFSENLHMDDEQPYAKLDPIEAQWRRRLYWLLFITERAYAVQQRKYTRLHASIYLPAVFEGEDPQSLNGFVNLANLFSAVDESFVSAWRGARRHSLCNEAWLAQTQRQLDAAALRLDDVSETQHLDIAITREWLHVLAWQMGVSNGLIRGKGEGGMRLDYPIELARKVVEITSGANALALDSHGIGMEQKLSDIAGCLADVLKCSAGDPSATVTEGKQHLRTLLQKLSSIRGKESRYLQPLMHKLDGVLGCELHPSASLPLPTNNPNNNDDEHMTEGATVGGFAFSSCVTPRPPARFSFSAESYGMLRSLSLSGALGMPMLAEWEGEQAQAQALLIRRPSGRVYDEYETKAMGAWLRDAC